MSNIDWEKIDTEYITTDCTYLDLCGKHGICVATMTDHGKKAGLVKRRADYRKTILDTALRTSAREQGKKLGALISSADMLGCRIDEVLQKADHALSASEARDYSTALLNLTKAVRDLNSLPSEIQRWEMEMQERKLALEQRKQDAATAAPPTVRVVMGGDADEYSE